MSTRLFTIGDFRFSVATAIGKWSRLATMGAKEKDGSRMEFNAETLGSMVDNFAARGDKLAICQDHLSAYVSQTGRPAPALGYFTALAVVQGGKVEKFATVAGNAQPDATGLEDGLYACLGEVTPLGADPLQGFAAFAFLSPMFSESAKDETGADIGMALYDAAVTNTPFQAGCSIQFHGIPAPAKKVTTGAARRFSQGAKMDDTEMAKRFGFEPDDDDAKKAEKMAKYFAGVDEMKAKMDAATTAAGSAITNPATMAAPFEGKETPAEEKAEKEAMSALSQSLAARGVTVPAGASRAVLMSLATLSPAPATDTAALKAQIKAELAAEAAATAEKSAREQLVTMARTAKAPEHEIQALGLLPLDIARQMAAKYAGNGTGAPAHIFAMASSQGAPIGGGPDGGRTRGMPAGNPAVHVREAKGGTTIIENDGEAAKMARDLRDSKDPIIMSRVDGRASEKFGRLDGFTRTLAAQEIIAQDHPHLVSRAG